MNICIVSVSFNPDLGGVVYDVAHELTMRGHSVCIFTGGGKNKVGEWVDHERFRVFRAHTFEVPWKLRSYVCVRNPLLERQWRVFLREVRPDVVHINQLYYQFPYSFVRIARTYTDRVFVTAHDVMAFSDRKLTRIVSSSCDPRDSRFDYSYPWPSRLKDGRLAFNPVRNMFIRRYLISATKIFSVSDALGEAMRQNGIKKVVTIHNGIDARSWKIDETPEQSKRSLALEGKKVILTIGRLSGEKGRAPLFESFTRVKRTIPNAALVLIGDDAGGKWNAEIVRRGFEHDVITRSLVKRSELPRWYAASDVVVVPSVCFDSFPTINLEAMACARPVVATCYGGSREVVEDGVSGFIVNPLNVEDLTEKITKILSDPSLARQLGQAGYERVSKDFRLDQQVDTILQYYE